MIKLVIMLLVCLSLSGCDSVEYKTFKMKSVAGEEFYMECPVVDKRKSTFGYVKEMDCVIINKSEVL